MARTEAITEDDLTPEGSVKAAQARYRDVDEIDQDALRRWAGKARDFQWDSANIRATRGQLVALAPMPFD